MSQRDEILALASEARPVIEEWLGAAEKIAAFRELATEKKIEWSQLKAVLVASIKDADGGDRLKKLSAAADNRLSYADILLNLKGPQRKEIKFSDPPAAATDSPSVATSPSIPEGDGNAADEAKPAASGPASIKAAAPVPLPIPDGNGTGASDSEIEAAALINDPPPLHPERIEPSGKLGIVAASTLSSGDDPFNCIPDFCRRTPLESVSRETPLVS